MMCGQWPKSHRIFQRPANALIGLLIFKAKTDLSFSGRTYHCWKSHVAAHVVFFFLFAQLQDEVVKMTRDHNLLLRETYNSSVVYC